MEKYQKQKNKLLKLCEKLSINYVDYWFRNRDTIWNKVLENNGEIDVFESKLKWESDLGKACQDAVREYIEKKQKDNLKQLTEEFRKGNILFKYAEIDFSDFFFHFNKKKYNITSFNKSIPTRAQTEDPRYLRGINLDGIRISGSKFTNCFFADASFRNCTFSQIVLKNTNLINTNFEDSKFIVVQFEGKSFINGANFKNAYINANTFTDNNLGYSGLEIKKIGYFKLLQWSFISIFKPVNTKIDDLKLTIFQANEINDIKKQELSDFKQYVIWFQKVYNNVIRKRPLLARIGFFFEALLSKYWSSFSSLFFITVLINLIFGSIIFRSLKHFSFTNMVSFIDCCYYSFCTFTNFGISEFSPISSIGQLIIIIESFTGFIFLGVFIFLLSKKISSRY